jgi:hypothetical protein
MSTFLNLHFWFNVKPGLMAPGPFRLVAISVLILAILSLVSYFVKRRNKGLYTKLWERLNTFFFSNLIIGTLLAFFSYEMVPLLSSRFWWPLWALSILVWLYFIVRHLLKLPDLRKQIDAEREYRKYLPQ